MMFRQYIAIVAFCVATTNTLADDEAEVINLLPPDHAPFKSVDFEFAEGFNVSPIARAMANRKAETIPDNAAGTTTFVAESNRVPPSP